jgi:hypothetical protein
MKPPLLTHIWQGYVCHVAAFGPWLNRSNVCEPRAAGARLSASTTSLAVGRSAGSYSRQRCIRRSTAGGHSSGTLRGRQRSARPQPAAFCHAQKPRQSSPVCTGQAALCAYLYAAEETIHNLPGIWLILLRHAAAVQQTHTPVLWTCCACNKHDAKSGGCACTRAAARAWAARRCRSPTASRPACGALGLVRVTPARQVTPSIGATARC